MILVMKLMTHPHPLGLILNNILVILRISLEYERTSHCHVSVGVELLIQVNGRATLKRVIGNVGRAIHWWANFQ